MASKDVPSQPEDAVPGRSRKGERTNYLGFEILAGARPREILERLLKDDPLNIYLISDERLMERAYLLDGHRLAVRSMARIAYHSQLYRGEPPLNDWILQRIDEAIDDLVREDHGDEVRKIPPEDSDEDRFSFLADALDSSLAVARTITVRFNNLREPERQAFHNLYVQGKSFNRYIAEGHGPPEHLRGLLRTAAAAFTEQTTLKFPEIEMDDIPPPTEGKGPEFDDFGFDDLGFDFDPSEGGP